MSTASDPIPAIKDDASERPIPSAWRPAIRAIVGALARHDYALRQPIAGVAPVTDSTANQVRDYLDDYGETLVDLPDASFDTSVCLWAGDRWDALVDLWTAAEGRSDLVLGLKVVEQDGGFEFHVTMVYVP